MHERRALWASTSTETRGGIATYVRAMQRTQLWSDWNIRLVSTHRDGSARTKIMEFARGGLGFVIQLIRFRPDVVHLHFASGASFIRKGTLFWISRAARIPVIIHMHGCGIEEYYLNSSRPMRAVIRATLDHADTVVALGRVWAQRLSGIAPAARITVIPNAIPTFPAVTQPGPGEPVRVVFLGRIGDRKGAFRLLDAWAELTSDEGDLSEIATLAIAGDGAVEQARHRISELGLESTVNVHTWLSEAETGELLDRSHVLVLPSRQEGQPMAVLEAMARGLCVIASDVGGLSEMIGDGCGIIVAPDDIEKIAAALRHVIYDGELRARFGAAAHERVATQFDVDDISRRIDALYREVIR